MQRILMLVLTGSLLMTTPLFASIPPELKPSGSGEIRYLGIFKVYDATLYAPEEKRATDILAADCSRCLRLDYAVEVSVDNFTEAAESVLLSQHDKAEIASVRDEIDTLHASYRDVKENDTYLLCYEAGSKTTRLVLNGTTQVSITSSRFAEMYFGIWLGEKNPIDQDLRTDLLAGLKGEEG